MSKAELYLILTFGILTFAALMGSLAEQSALVRVLN